MDSNKNDSSDVQEIMQLASMGAFSQPGSNQTTTQQSSMMRQGTQAGPSTFQPTQQQPWSNVAGGFQAMLQQAPLPPSNYQFYQQPGVMPSHFNQPMPGQQQHFAPQGQFSPPTGCNFAQGQFSPTGGSNFPQGQFSPPSGCNFPQGQFSPPGASNWVTATASSHDASTHSPVANIGTRTVEADVSSPRPKRGVGRRTKTCLRKPPRQPVYVGDDDGDEVEEVEEVEEEHAARRAKKSNFVSVEDCLLVTCWLEVSMDPMTNTGQKRETFWNRVHTMYNSRCSPRPERSKRSLQTRYDVIKNQVAKFTSYVAAVNRRNPSGMTDAYKLAQACTEFAALESGSFQLMHCYEIMKDIPKYMDTKHGRKVRDAEQDVFVVTSHPKNKDGLSHPGSFRVFPAKRELIVHHRQG